MQKERWLPFRPEECPESVWDQLLEDGRRKVIDVFAMLMARAARAGTTPNVGEEAASDFRDS